MLKNFPILSDEKIEEYTRKGYVLVFRHLNAINKERPKEILNKDDFQEAIKELEKYPYYDKITKVMPFNEGYEFLKESNIQYNLRSQLADELTSWASYYNISDETDLEARQRFLENVTNLEFTLCYNNRT
mgnify:FL=1